MSLRLLLLALLLGSWVGPSAQAAWTGRFGVEYSVGQWKHPGVLDSRVGHMGSLKGSAGLEKWILYLGPEFQYFFAAQLTSPDRVSGSNMLGRGYLGSALAVITLGPLRVTGAYDVFGKYIFSNLTIAGEEQSYSLPQVSWRAGIGYRLTRILSVDLNFQKTDFKRHKVGGAIADYPIQQGLSVRTLGLGLSLQF